MAKAYPRAACALGIGLLLTGLLVGCGGGKSNEDVVAKVNDIDITVGYFEAKWGKLASGDPLFDPTPSNIDSLREAVLDILIKKELMVDRAKKEDFDDDPVYLEAYENQKNYRLIELLKNKQVVDLIPEFTEEELLDHYQYVGYAVTARHIDMDTEDEAKAVVEMIRGGEISFAEAVSKYSTHQDRKGGGQLGVVQFGANIKPVEDALFSMEVGDVSEPVKTPYGWSFFIVDDFKKNKQDEYVSVRESIKHRLEMRAMREIGGAHAERVLDKYGFEFYWDVAERILGYMPDDMTPSQANQARSRTEEKPVLKFSPEELEMVLYELDGEKITLQAFSDEYDRLHPFARPQKSSRLQGIYNFVHKEAVGQMMPKEAMSIGLEKDPELILALKEFEEQACIGAVRRVLVDRPITITDEELLGFYEENPLYYTLRPRVRCKQIINSEEEKIREAWNRLQEGEAVDEVGRDLSIVFNRQWVTDWFTADSLEAKGNDAILHIARLTEIGEYTEPFYYQGYWGIMELFEQEAARLMEFEEARDRVETDLRARKEGERLDMLLDEWRQDAVIEIDHKMLAKTEKGPEPSANRGRF